MEIEVGEYGRTNLGNIIKFAWIEKEPGIIDNRKVILVDKMKETVDHFYYFKRNEIITKHSKNIIDLIEVGDYVNGYRVERYLDGDLVLEDEIKSILKKTIIEEILTHEQYENNCYRLEE